MPRLAHCSLAAAALLCFLPRIGGAQGWIEPHDAPGRWGVHRTGSQVRVTVSGPVARVEVTEWFRNDGPGVAEGHYLYPLPGEAAFDGFSLFMGGQELRGETLDAHRARSIYEEIVRRRKDPALIELVGHGLIRARVFPIEAGQTRKIALRYDQLLESAGDALRFAYAAGVPRGGRRFPNRTLEVRPLRGEPPEEATEIRREASGTDFRMVVEDGDAYLEPFSPTHDLVSRRRDGHLLLEVQGEVAGDLSVFLPRAERRVGISLAVHRPVGEDGYFMLTLTPGEAPRNAEPRDIAVVLDVSGSMSGPKLDQARSALLGLLETLSPRDRFRLAAFSNSVQAFRLEWTQASSGALTEARSWVTALEARGGTNLEAALHEAFRLDSPPERLPMVIFLTDGLPTVGQDSPEALARRARERRGRARVFAFGVGYDVNTYLLDGLSAAGRGATQYVEPGEDVERALSLLADKIRHPVLTDLALARAPVGVQETYPATLPDLFAGEELILFGRYSGEGRGELVLEGRRGGRQLRYAVDVEFPGHAEAQGYLPRLWASRKLGFLTRRLSLEGRDPELVEEIRRTALRYGLLSEYTAYLVQEPELAAALPGEADQSILRAPAAASGRGAVRMAQVARERRQVQSAPGLRRMEKDLADRADAMNQEVPEEDVADGVRGARAVAGRLFLLQGGVWTDELHREGHPVKEVRVYSPAWFDLLEALPEIRPYLAAFESVLVKGVGTSLRAGEGGVDRLNPEQLRELVRSFREGDPKSP